MRLNVKIPGVLITAFLAVALMGLATAEKAVAQGGNSGPLVVDL